MADITPRKQSCIVTLS